MHRRLKQPGKGKSPALQGLQSAVVGIVIPGESHIGDDENSKKRGIEQPPAFIARTIEEKCHTEERKNDTLHIQNEGTTEKTASHF